MVLKGKNKFLKDHGRCKTNAEEVKHHRYRSSSVTSHGKWNKGPEHENAAPKVAVHVK